MRYVSRLISFSRRWKSAGQARLLLDTLLSRADPDASIAERNEWLIELFRWLHGAKGLEEDRSDSAPAPALRVHALVRLRFLLNVLDRNPEWKLPFTRTLQAIFRDLDAVALLCDTGLPQHPGYWSELSERLTGRLIPPTPNTRDWSALLTLLFPRTSDGEWIGHIDEHSLGRVLVLFTENGAIDPPQISRHLAPALTHSIHFLLTQVQATGIAQPIRSRMGLKDFAESPFLSLTRSFDELLAFRSSVDGAEKFPQGLNLLRAQLDECRLAARRVFDHLEENGVSVVIVFQIERLLARMHRVELLLELWLDAGSPPVIARVVGDLVETHQAGRSVSDLTRRSFAQLARKVVERSAETGEHYIARDGREYREMLSAALGGGALTAITVHVKFLIAALSLPKLGEALFGAMNYATSFVAMQFAGFTLATKQPAMTAPALAKKLEDVGKPQGMEAFVDETICLVRSQFAAIAGNLVAVMPVVIAIQLLIMQLFGASLLSPEKAQATVASLSLSGPTPLFAMFTGVLLWLSSLCAGWADNWFAYRRIADVIAYHRRLRWVLGARGAARLAEFWRHHVSGLAANVSLGLMLALAPPLLSVFLPFNLEVRHVTLSTGSLAASSVVLGWSLLATTGFWLAVGGIASMALLNLSVSFSLAFQLALRARVAARVERKAIYRAVLRRIVRDPASLFVVQRTSLKTPGAGDVELPVQPEREHGNSESPSAKLD